MLGSVSASPFGRSEEQRVLNGAVSAVINTPGTKGGEIPEQAYDCYIPRTLRKVRVYHEKERCLLFDGKCYPDNR